MNQYKNYQTLRIHLDKTVIVVDRLRIRTIDRDCDDEPINKIKVKYVLYLRIYEINNVNIKPYSA